MKLKALDSFYTSETKQVRAGQEFTAKEFDLSDERISEMTKKGLIGEVKSDAAPSNKAEPAPKNKAETPVDNKGK